jgi:uracil-DNA glycosylase
MELPDTIDDTLMAVRQHLVRISGWGCAGFDCAAPALDALDRWSRPIVAPALAPESLDEIRAHLGECRDCGLSGHRSRILFGQGDPKAQLVFVGPWPGSDEDLGGNPFAGPAGQLLTRIIEAMRLTREQVYICYVVKCRTPENRDPLLDEIQACEPFLKRQIAAIRPKVICTLGPLAVRTLLDTRLPFSELRGRFHDFEGIKVMPTLDPAHLLNNPDQKKSVWDDVRKIMAFLRIPL